MDFTVEGKHPAALAAVKTVPGIGLRVEPQLSAAVTADGAVGIYPDIPSPPDIQAEKVCHVHNGKGEI